MKISEKTLKYRATELKRTGFLKEDDHDMAYAAQQAYSFRRCRNCLCMTIAHHRCYHCDDADDDTLPSVADTIKRLAE